MVKTADWRSEWQPMVDAVGTDFGDGIDREGPDAVELGALRKFVEPLEFGCPLHYDRELARRLGYRDVVSPVSAILTFTIQPVWRTGEPPVFTSPDRDAQPASQATGPRLTGLEPPITGFFAADMAADFLTPVVVGDRLSRRGNRLLSCTPKETSVGRGAFLVWQTEVRNQRGELVSRLRNTAYYYQPHPRAPSAYHQPHPHPGGPPARGAIADPPPAADGGADGEPVDWSRQRYWEDVTEGQALPPVRYPLSVYRLVMAAGSNRDFNSIHHNGDWAQATGAPDMYANVVFLHGMWERCVREFIGVAGQIRQVSGFRMGSFNTAGDVVTVRGTVSRAWTEAGEGLAELRLESRNSRGVSVGPGTVTATLPRRPA
jgi:acyl dehydratase